jgi:predicted Zn-dependent protease
MTMMLRPPLPLLLPPTRWRPRAARRLCRGLAAALLVQALAAAPAWAQPAVPVPPNPAEAAAARGNLPALGDTASESFSLGAEAKLGQQIMRSIRRDPDYLDDPVLLEYLQSVWQPLLAASRKLGQVEIDTDQRFAWEPFLVRDRSVNAFALPGGYVGVHLGLIAMTDARDELAAVLAHEMTHVTQRHIARSFDNSKQQSLISIAALIIGVLAASRSNSSGPGAGDALIAGGQASAMQGALNFSRDMEREADRIGFSVLTNAGFAPAGMASMFEKLERSSRLNDAGGFPYLRSHPLNAARIGEAKARLGAGTPVSPPPLPGNRMEHALMQARARVLMDPRVEALRRWQVLEKDKEKDTGTGEAAEKLGVLYSGALASTLLHEWARVDSVLAKAQALLARPDARRDARAERLVALLRTQSMLERGDAPGAWAAWQPHANEPSRPAMLMTAQVATALLGQAAPASKAAGQPLASRLAEDLQGWVSSSPQDVAAWAALSQVQGALGQRLRAMRADAEAHFAEGDWDGASDRLRAAQRLPRSNDPGDFIELSVIDARLRSIDAQRRQLAIESRGGR